MWRSDGTPDGTVRLKTASELACQGCRWIKESVVWKGALYSILDGGQIPVEDLGIENDR
jgi:hypothetical protein